MIKKYIEVESEYQPNNKRIWRGINESKVQLQEGVFKILRGSHPISLQTKWNKPNVGTIIRLVQTWYKPDVCTMYVPFGTDTVVVPHGTNMVHTSGLYHVCTSFRGGTDIHLVVVSGMKGIVANGWLRQSML